MADWGSAPAAGRTGLPDVHRVELSGGGGERDGWPDAGGGAAAGTLRELLAEVLLSGWGGGRGVRSGFEARPGQRSLRSVVRIPE